MSCVRVTCIKVVVERKGRNESAEGSHVGKEEGQSPEEHRRKRNFSCCFSVSVSVTVLDYKFFQLLFSFS